MRGSGSSVQVLPPAGYLDLLLLMKRCEAILTDSGGLQEEATASSIRKPVVVFRKRTERPEAVRAVVRNSRRCNKNRCAQSPQHDVVSA